MNNIVKDMFGFVIIGCILMVVISVVVMLESKNKSEIQIQCKEVGGTWTYENNSWYCK